MGCRLAVRATGTQRTRAHRAAIGRRRGSAPGSRPFTTAVPGDARGRAANGPLLGRRRRALPAAYRDLEEDRLSDLLAATLNASLPGAAREVHSRGGKSDLYIKADVLATGAGPEKVFIAESKWWHGPEKALKAQMQLLNYLQVRDTSAILLLYRQGHTAPLQRQGSRRARDGGGLREHGRGPGRRVADPQVRVRGTPRRHMPCLCLPATRPGIVS